MSKNNHNLSKDHIVGHKIFLNDVQLMHNADQIIWNNKNIDLVGGILTANTFTDRTFSVTGGVITGASGNISQWTNDSSYFTSITGLAPDTATTAASQPNITSVGSLTSLGMAGDIDLNNNDIGEVKTLTFNAEIDDGNSSTADTIDFGAGPFHKSTLTGNCTYTFTAPAGPCTLILKLVQDATGGREVTWPATVKWEGGNIPALSGAGLTDLVSFYYDGTNYYGSAMFNMS